MKSPIEIELTDEELEEAKNEKAKCQREYYAAHKRRVMEIQARYYLKKKKERILKESEESESHDSRNKELTYTGFDVENVDGHN